MLREFDGKPVAGGTYPALIWKAFMKRALQTLGEEPKPFPYLSEPGVYPYRVTFRDGRWRLDNGYCRNVRELDFFYGRQPTNMAACKPNEVDVPKVVGLTIDDAEGQLASAPLKYEVITKPAKPGERLDLVTAQFPARGTLSAGDTVRIVVPKALEGIVPDVVGTKLRRARNQLAKLGVRARANRFRAGKRGIVLAQHPAAGVAAGRHLTVRLVVGRG
jgi:hypothetical protein